MFIFYLGEIVRDPNCPEPTGMFPDPKNCSLFYHCEHGVAYPKRCSPPLMFNPEEMVCDWPNNVDCGKGTILFKDFLITLNHLYENFR